MVLIDGLSFPFEVKPHPDWFNLEIYPEINELETIAGLMSDIAEMYISENKTCDYIIESKNMDFLILNLYHFKKDGTIKINFNSENYQNNEYDFIINKFFFGNDFMENRKSIKIENTDYFIHIKKEIYPFWYLNFKYYFVDDIFYYSNLICYCMIIKNGNELLSKVLRDNLPFIDRWCILDTGSTDGSQDTILEILKNKKGELFSLSFDNFRDSRNKCLELAGKSCKFIIMLDDTYVLNGNIRSFLNEVRGDVFSDSFSLMIQSEDTEYYSNRIIKSKSNLRYIHKIHEVISEENNTNVSVPSNVAYIFDYRSESMEKRTTDRKQFDLKLLFEELEENPDDPRSLYYIAQTYGCISDEKNKAKYFELRISHPVQGYIQEKIDAIFELARTYNFKIDYFTKEPLTSFTQEHWKICEELYLQAYELDQTRPESLYFIGIYYFLNNNYHSAYNYFKKAFELGYPINSQYSLKPTLSFHFLPKFLTEVCYYLEDYNLGKQAADLFLFNNKVNGNSWNLMNNWYNIHNHLEHFSLKEPSSFTKELIVIVTDGGWEPWSGKDLEIKGLGGSETWVIETARHLQLIGKNVVVFCNTMSSELFENVGYNPIELFNKFIAENEVNHVIISRYTEYIPLALKGHAKSVSVIFHDILSPEIIIPVHPKIKCLIGLTDWHKNTISKTFPQFKTETLNYGININSISSLVKIKNSFIYSSFPNRGLVILLRMWLKILRRLPDATLHIYCNLEHEWVNKVAPEQMKEIKENINQQGVYSHGWVCKKELTEAWQTAEYWLYPCIFAETFCSTAHEASVNKTFVISNNLAALGETIGDRGLIVQGDPWTQKWQDKIINNFFNIYYDKIYKNDCIERNYKWGSKLTWKSQTKKLLRLI